MDSIVNEDLFGDDADDDEQFDDFNEAEDDNFETEDLEPAEFVKPKLDWCPNW